MKVDTYTYDGKKYEINFSPTTGQFSTEVGEDNLVTAASLDDLKKKIARSRRKAGVRIALPATRVIGAGRWNSQSDEQTQLQDVTVTGLHQRNRSILIRIDQSKQADTVDDYRGHLLRRLTGPEKATYLRLAKASRESRVAFEKFVDDHKFGKQQIEREVAQAEKAAGIQEGDDD